MKVREIMQQHVRVIAESESVGMAQTFMRWTDVRHLPVVSRDTGRVIGILSERDLLRAVVAAETTHSSMSRPVRELMTSPVEHIHPDAELADAAADMAVKKVGCLPVIVAGSLVGIITRADVLSVLAQYPADYRAEKTPPEPPPAAAVMHPEPVAVQARERLLTAAARMATAHTRHACVVDDEGRVIGLLSDRDVRRVIGDPVRALEVDRAPDRLRDLSVEPVMTRNPKTIGQDEPFTNALPLLVDARIGALPVVDRHGHLRGIMSYVDVLKALAMYVPSTLES